MLHVRISWINWRKRVEITRLRLIPCLSLIRGCWVSSRISSTRRPEIKLPPICRSSMKLTRHPLTFPITPCLRTDWAMGLKRLPKLEDFSSRIWMAFNKKRKRKYTTRKDRTVVQSYQLLRHQPQSKLQNLTKCSNSSKKEWRSL